MVFKSQQYRLYPNKSQKPVLDFQLEKMRWIWNKALEDLRDRHDRLGVRQNFPMVERAFYQNVVPKCPWMTILPSTAIQSVLWYLTQRFEYYLDTGQNIPVYLGKNYRNSVRYYTGVEYHPSRGRLHLPEIGYVRMEVFPDAPIPPIKPVSVCVTRNTNGMYHVMVYGDFDPIWGDRSSKLTPFWYTPICAQYHDDLARKEWAVKNPRGTEKQQARIIRDHQLFTDHFHDLYDWFNEQLETKKSA